MVIQATGHQGRVISGAVVSRILVRRCRSGFPALNTLNHSGVFFLCRAFHKSVTSHVPGFLSFFALTPNKLEPFTFIRSGGHQPALRNRDRAEQDLFPAAAKTTQSSRGGWKPPLRRNVSCSRKP